MDILEVAKEARRIFRLEGTWTQRVMARDSLGLSCAPTSSGAQCWCTAGAFINAANCDARLEDEALRQVSDFCLARLGMELLDWNDAEGRTQEEVLKFMDEFISTLT